VLFRTASDPDVLRGPNLGWFWPDEAALMSVDVWPVMLARLRLSPGQAWVTTTPRGKRNWTHTTFATGGPKYRTIVASTRGAFWNPPEFLDSMLGNYSPDFARQEIDAEVLDDEQEGLVPLWWLDAMETWIRAAGHPAGRRRMGVDLGYGTGRDSFTCLVRDDLGILGAIESPYVGVPQAAQLVQQQATRWRVRQEDIVFDAGGPGRDLPRYLEAYGIEAVPYHGNGKGGPHFENRRSRCAWRLRQRLDPSRPLVLPTLPENAGFHPLFPPAPPGVQTQPPFALPADRPWWPQLRQELGELKYTTRARKACLEKKEDLAARLKRSPDLCDALIMSFYDAA
jgi:hypothetical protein